VLLAKFGIWQGDAKVFARLVCIVARVHPNTALNAGDITSSLEVEMIVHNFKVEVDLPSLLARMV
jgi:hypothetical protein